MSSDVLVNQNRWDLLPCGAAPRVAVVVTHYEQPRTLPLVLDALHHQTLAPVEIVVADDGSAVPPEVPAGVRLVRQENLGFRAAAARNLGAAASTAPTLVFLDADTVPEPGFLAALTQRLASCPDVLAVGRRRHADLLGDGRELPEPAWLRDGYARSRNLLDADGRSFRYVISAAMACSRSLFEDLGGFDKRFVGYGGEDWDLGYRAWNNGAVLVHERDAVAWHDGPAAGLLPDKDRESLRLSARIPEPATRGAPLPALLPDVLVDLASYDARCVHSLLRQDHRDLLVRVPHAGDLHVPFTRTEQWTGDQLARARVRVRLDEPVALADDSLTPVVDALTRGGLGELVLTAGGQIVGLAQSTRALGRQRRWPGGDVIGAAFGRRDWAMGIVPARADMAGFFSSPWS